MRARFLFSVIMTLTLAFGALGITTPALASCPTSITVTSANNDGTGSLRQALLDMCTTGGTINFDSDYTIRLASTLSISHNINIDGAGHTIVISGDTTGDGTGDVQVFYIMTGVTATLNSLTITKGSSIFGGGIENEGTLTVTNSTFSGNSAMDTGGGIDNYHGSVTVTNSTFSNNSAFYGGGGIYSAGTLTVTNSTFSGSDIRSQSGTLNYANTILVNSTGVNCVSDGTIGINTNNLVQDGSCGASLTGNPLLSSLGNHGGSTQTFALLPGSKAIDAGDSDTCSAAPVSSLDQRGIARPSACDIGAFESQGFTLTKTGGDGQSAAINTAFTNPLALSVTSASGEPVDGGKLTFTPPVSGASAVITGSPATIASGAASVSATANGIIGGPYNVTASAVGASSIDFSLTNLCVNNVVVANNANSGAGSLRQAINDVCADGTITFDNDYTITLASQLTIPRNMTINGAGHAVTISGNNAVRVMDIETVHATLNHLTIANGKASDWGGGIQNNAGGTLTILNSTFHGNNAPYSGAIFNGATLNIANCSFYENTADTDGGAIGNKVATLTVTNSTIFGNSATSGIGGISNHTGTATVYNTILADNTGGNCSNSVDGTITDGGHNIDSASTCGWDSTNDSMSSTNPLLGAFGNYGGTTQTLPLLPGSPAINAGDSDTCSAAPVSSLDQRGVARPSACDIGAFESQGFTLTKTGGDGQSATVNTAFTNPLALSVTSAHSEPVDGGKVTFTPPASGASAVITGSPATIASGAVSVSATANGIVGGPYNVTASAAGAVSINFALTNSAIPTITLTLKSVGAQDGWVLESGEISNVGGTINNTAQTFNLGDDAAKKQYRGILSFSTGGLPDNAVITAVTLKVKKSAIVGGGNPVATFKGFKVDIKNGIFGTAALQASDFQAAASKTYGPFNTALVGGWYNINLTAGKGYINKTTAASGLTQIRLRFNLDDNNNAIANVLSLYSGNATAAAYRPQLIIIYYVP